MYKADYTCNPFRNGGIFMIYGFVLSVKKRAEDFFSNFRNDDKGIGVVEVILILVEILTHRYMYI